MVKVKIFNSFLYGVLECEPKYKIPTMVLVGFLITILLIGEVPGIAKVISGILLIPLISLLAAVRN